MSYYSTIYLNYLFLEIETTPDNSRKNINADSTNIKIITLIKLKNLHFHQDYLNFVIIYNCERQKATKI